MAAQATAPAKPPVMVSDLSLETLSSAEALIERTGRPRILLDAADQVQNTALVDAFLAVAGLDVDVWCLFPGPLKAWMRPDMLLEDIPAAEYGLYFASVDVAVMTHVDAGVQRAGARLAWPAVRSRWARRWKLQAALASAGVLARPLQPQDQLLRDVLAALTTDPARLLELRQTARTAASAFKAAVS